MMVQIGKYKLRKETPRVIWNKRIRPIWDKRLRDNDVWTNRFLVITNNFCDQQCYSCSALCNTPFGSNPFRFEPHTTPITSIKQFLEHIDGYRPKYWIRLSGGEVTLLPKPHIEKICQLSHQHGRPVSLLTNGAKMQNLDPWLFDFIHLDQHIKNRQTIIECREYFKHEHYPYYQVWTTIEHRDLELQRTGNITKALECEAWMEAITLWRDTVYPCCVLPFLDGWNGNDKIRLSLREAGWSLDNPRLVETMENYLTTFPDDAHYACQYQCWKDGVKLEYHPVSTD